VRAIVWVGEVVVRAEACASLSAVGESLRGTDFFVDWAVDSTLAASICYQGESWRAVKVWFADALAEIWVPNAGNELVVWAFLTYRRCFTDSNVSARFIVNFKALQAG
jgi:hypothetical protein